MCNFFFPVCRYNVNGFIYVILCLAFAQHCKILDCSCSSTSQSMIKFWCGVRGIFPVIWKACSFSTIWDWIVLQYLSQKPYHKLKQMRVQQSSIKLDIKGTWHNRKQCHHSHLNLFGKILIFCQKYYLC